MSILIGIGLGYLIGASLVAMRLGFHLRYRLDRHDWEHSKVWPSFWVGVLLWPLFLLKPSLLVTPVFKGPWWDPDRADNERALDLLAMAPPQCGTRIRYAPHGDGLEYGGSGEFEFTSAAVEAVMSKRLAELPAEQHCRLDEILGWVQQRQTDVEKTEVPELWQTLFLTVARGMVNRGLAEVRCSECKTQIAIDTITTQWIPPGHGWRYQVWVCQAGHPLLSRDSMHIYAPER